MYYTTQTLIRSSCLFKSMEVKLNINSYQTRIQNIVFFRCANHGNIKTFQWQKFKKYVNTKDLDFG